MLASNQTHRVYDAFELRFCEKNSFCAIERVMMTMGEREIRFKKRLEPTRSGELR